MIVVKWLVVFFLFGMFAARHYVFLSCFEFLSLKTYLYCFGEIILNRLNILVCSLKFTDNSLFLSSCSQNHLNLVVVNNVPLFFNIRDGPYMPTLRLLHQCNFFLPNFLSMHPIFQDV